MEDTFEQRLKYGGEVRNGMQMTLSQGQVVGTSPQGSEKGGRVTKMGACKPLVRVRDYSESNETIGGL